MELLEHSVNKAITNFPMVNHIRFKILSIFNSAEYIVSSVLLVFTLKTGFVCFVWFLLWVQTDKVREANKNKVNYNIFYVKV